MQRTRAFRRDIRHHAICKKKAIVHARDGAEWYSVDGKYDKGKVHCGCNLCKYGRAMGFPTLRTEREMEKFKFEYSDYVSGCAAVLP